MVYIVYNCTQGVQLYTECTVVYRVYNVIQRGTVVYKGYNGMWSV